MSQSELQRFADAVRTSPALLEAYRDSADPAELAARLRAGGYDVTDDEVVASVRSGQDLSEEQLDQVSGGLATAAIIGGGIGLAGLAFAGVAGAWIWAGATIAKAAQEPPSNAPDPTSYRFYRRP